MLTLGAVTPTVTKNASRGGQGQEGSGGQDHSGCSRDHVNSSIAKYSFEGKMKDGYLSKFTITDGSKIELFNSRKLLMLY